MAQHALYIIVEKYGEPGSSDKEPEACPSLLSHIGWTGRKETSGGGLLAQAWSRL